MVYFNQRVSLLTQHGKELVIGPELLASSGVKIIHTTGYDTDRLGTFTRETPRPGTQLEAARKKARLGMQLTNLTTGVASEGAFSNDPHTGILPWNYELVVFLDDMRGIEIVGHYGGGAQSAIKSISDLDQIDEFLEIAKFPSHQLVVRPDDERYPECRKGIKDIRSLHEAIRWAKQKSKQGKIVLENDLRAHANPTRMANILKATQDLSRKLSSLCPQCQVPGFWITEFKKGLPCLECATPTHLPTTEVWVCNQCNFKNEVELDEKFAEPSKCPQCNP